MKRKVRKSRPKTRNPLQLDSLARYDKRMKSNQIVDLAQQLLEGQLSEEQFVRQLALTVSADLGDVQLDLDRVRRCGYPEVVYAEGKSIDALRRVFARLLEAGQPVLATRVSVTQSEQLLVEFPTAEYNPVGRTFRVESDRDGGLPRIGTVALVTAGTSDQPVAEEARETLDWMHVEVRLVQDVGVAGPHRLPAHLDQLANVDAVIVVAGMEGALPSVVGGYVACPVIGVPTSVGYGASYGGTAALLGMLNSCAANVIVVNIDAGFKAGYVAGLIARRSKSDD